MPRAPHSFAPRRRRSSRFIFISMRFRPSPADGAGPAAWQKAAAALTVQAPLPTVPLARSIAIAPGPGRRRLGSDRLTGARGDRRRSPATTRPFDQGHLNRTGGFLDMQCPGRPTSRPWHLVRGSALTWKIDENPIARGSVSRQDSVIVMVEPRDE
jgi:hypothetical protein